MADQSVAALADSMVDLMDGLKVAHLDSRKAETKVVVKVGRKAGWTELEMACQKAEQLVDRSAVPMDDRLVGHSACCSVAHSVE